MSGFSFFAEDRASGVICTGLACHVSVMGSWQTNVRWNMDKDIEIDTGTGQLWLPIYTCHSVAMLQCYRYSGTLEYGYGMEEWHVCM